MWQLNYDSKFEIDIRAINTKERERERKGEREKERERNKKCEIQCFEQSADFKNGAKAFTISFAASFLNFFIN